ncbi:MAG: mannose-6-phosphate isomerase, class I [Chromatiaceae bacterium]|nr:mannose-6-phosphate isomerase, class I [Chromatiaceae bacterium]
MNPSAHATAVEEFRRRPRPLVLRCGVQHYAWGDREFIPDLIGVTNRDRKPFAELWIGAHSDLPSMVCLGGIEVPLPSLLRGASEAVLGRRDAERFNGQLPFLLKVLSAAQPLSIQAHPNRRQAREGFARENRSGVATDSPKRNYHDENHKPELIAALTDFYALRGFRPLGEIASVIASIPELGDLASDYRATSESLADLYGRVMRKSQREVDALLTPIVQRLGDENARQPFSKEQTEYWILRADAIFSNDDHRDRGLFSLFLLNLVHLSPGEAMYLPAGELHAYLQGSGVEIMANSNNVLRGGLTPKHTDTEELLRILTFDAGEASVISLGFPPEEGGTVVYETPSEEFRLSRLRIAAERPYRSEVGHSLQLGVVTQGSVTLTTDGSDVFELEQGGVLLVPHGLDYRISSREDAVAFLAGVPDD